MRVVTRPDFDGIVCAVLLQEALAIDEPVRWVEPNVMQSGRVEIRKDDIIANLSYHKNCLLWFDHHVSNSLDIPFNGAFKVAPSAAGIIFDFFNSFDAGKNPAFIADRVKGFQRDYTELVAAADKIDAARLNLDEVEHPEKYPYLCFSMTIVSYKSADEPYWNRLVELLRKYDLQKVLKDPEVRRRCKASLEQNETYAALLKEHTVINKHVSITDFRSFETMPIGNRFLVFSLFPETAVNVKIRHHDDDRERLIVSVGRNIFNDRCKVNTGMLCARFGGGGHYGAGSCCFHSSKTDEYLPVILEAVSKNEE